MNTPCSHCPNVSGTCLAIRAGHARLCQLVDPTHPDYSEHYVRLVVEGPDAPEPAPPPEVRTDPALRSKLDLVNACPHRSDTLKECSCTGRKRCAMNKGQFANEPWAVTLADCLRCVAEPAEPLRDPPKRNYDDQYRLRNPTIAPSEPG